LEAGAVEEACGATAIDMTTLMQEVARVHGIPLTVIAGMEMPAQILALTPPPPTVAASN
jgi:hypothetical protein